MLKKSFILVSSTLSVVFFSGCATIISGKTQSINVTSKTPTTFSIDGAQYTTPAKVVVKRSKENKTIQVDGCEDVVLHSVTNPVVYGNIIAGGLVGSSVDSGAAAWKYEDSIELCK